MHEVEIIEQLEKHRSGLLKQQLLKYLKLGEKNRTFDDDIVDLVKQDEIKKKEIYKIPDHKVKEFEEEGKFKEEELEKLKMDYKRILLFRPQYKDLAFHDWEIDKYDELSKDINKIECGFLLIKKGALTQPIRRLYHYAGDYYIFNERLARSGMLNRFVDVDDKSDFLYFWVENRNNHAIEGIEARIKVSPSFYEPMVPREKDCCKCKYNSNYTDITITCERLLPWVKQMPNDIAYVLIPLKRDNEHLMNDDERHEMMPIVEVWYKDVRIKKIKGGEVTSDTSRGEPFFLI